MTSTDILRSYLRLPDKKEVQERSSWQSLVANGRRVAEYHLRRDGWTLTHEAKYNVPCTKVQVSRRSSGAGIYCVRPRAGYGRCLFDSRPWGRQNITQFGGIVKGGYPALVFISPFDTNTISACQI